MSKSRMKQLMSRNRAQDNRGGREANPAHNVRGAASTKRGEKAKKGKPFADEESV